MSLYTGEQAFSTPPPTGEITSIAPGGTENTEKKLDTLEAIAEVARSIETRGRPKSEILQEVSHLMVSSLTAIQREVDPNSRQEIVESAQKAQKVQTFIKGLIEPILPEGDSWHMRRNGFLAEVATSVFLERAGFEVLEPSQEDDMKGKIDLWAVDSAEGKAYAVQIKASKDMEGAKLTKADPSKESLGVMSGYRDSVQTMIKYVTEREELAGKEIEFLVIELGAGEINENAAFNQVTGVLSKKADESLNDQLYTKVWNE